MFDCIFEDDNYTNAWPDRIFLISQPFAALARRSGDKQINATVLKTLAFGRERERERMKRGGRERKLLPCRDSRFLSLFFFFSTPTHYANNCYFFFHTQSTGKWSSTSFLCKLFRRLFTRQANWTNSVVFFTLSFVK